MSHDDIEHFLLAFFTTTMEDDDVESICSSNLFADIKNKNIFDIQSKIYKIFAQFDDTVPLEKMESHATQNVQKILIKKDAIASNTINVEESINLLASIFEYVKNQKLFWSKTLKVDNTTEYIENFQKTLDREISKSKKLEQKIGKITSDFQKRLDRNVRKMESKFNTNTITIIGIFTAIVGSIFGTFSFTQNTLTAIEKNKRYSNGINSACIYSTHYLCHTWFYVTYSLSYYRKRMAQGISVAFWHFYRSFYWHDIFFWLLYYPKIQNIRY